MPADDPRDALAQRLHAVDAFCLHYDATDGGSSFRNCATVATAILADGSRFLSPAQAADRAAHADDSYGYCTRCRIELGADSEGMPVLHLVRFPCPAAALSDAEAERDAAQRRADIAETNLRLAVDDLTHERDTARADAERLVKALEWALVVVQMMQTGYRLDPRDARALVKAEDVILAALALHRERRPAEEGG